MAAFIQFVLVAAIVGPSFIVFVLHVAKTLRDWDDKWNRNKQRRQQRKASDNVRMAFDKRGVVVKENLAHLRRLEVAESILALLSTLAENFKFGNITLYKYHTSLKLTNNVAKRCSEAVHNFLGNEDVDLALMSSFDTLEKLLVDLMNGRTPTIDPVEVMNDFKGQIAVLHAVYGESEVARGSWTYNGDATKGIVEALLGPDQVGKKVTAVPDFKKNPVAGFAKTATELLRKSKRYKKAKAAGEQVVSALRVRHLEPTSMVSGIELRATGLLFHADEMGDKYSVGSRGLLVAITALFLVVGPVRFLGIWAGILALLVIAIDILLCFARAGETSNIQGFLKQVWVMSPSLIIPVVLAMGVIALLACGWIFPPGSVYEIQSRFTFLPLPPHYVKGVEEEQRYAMEPLAPQESLVTVFRSPGFIALIYGVMHSNLLVLCMLPLPLCYHLQGKLMQCCPRLGFLIPRNPVWLHRTLGYMLLGGLLSAAVVWLIFQGVACLSDGFEDAHACDAFDPQAPVFQDVFVLRFQVVWPLVCFFIPLMIFDRYPEWTEPKSAPAEAATAPSPLASRTAQSETTLSVQTPRSVRATGASPLSTQMSQDSTHSPGNFSEGQKQKKTGFMSMLPSRKKKEPPQPVAEEAQPLTSSTPEASSEQLASLPSASSFALVERSGLLDAWRSVAPEVRDAVTGEQPRTCFARVRRFLYRRTFEVCVFVVPLAGSILTVMQAGTSRFFPIFVPIWLMVLLVVMVHLFMVFKGWLASLVGVDDKKLGHDSWTEFLRGSWWEIAFLLHIIAVALLLGFALLVRFQVFWPALLTWGLYFLDRFLSARGGCMAPILVGQQHSSYIITGIRNGYPQPTHVRLVLKKPEGFKYQAGQWCHIALHQIGAYCGAPRCASSMLQWHAFSIASAEHEENLEFHIAVSAGDGDGTSSGVETVTISQVSEQSLGLAREGRLLDRICPHIVPHSNGESAGVVRGASYTVDISDTHLHLTSQEGRSVQVLKPQPQWTGRLWNVVQWMSDRKGRGLQVPEQMVNITGPYGMLPYTCQAHQAVMLIGAGTGFASTGSMLRKLLNENEALPPQQRKSVCFMWSASKVDQLLLCFPSLLADLSRYVHRRSLDDLRSWLTVKMFVSQFDASDFLNIDPEVHLFPEKKDIAKDMKMVREWLLGEDRQPLGDEGQPNQSFDDEHQVEDGTYIAQGSLGGSFGDILRCSLFVKEHVIAPNRSLGICYCGPAELGSWIKSEADNTVLPVQVEYSGESTGG